MKKLLSILCGMCLILFCACGQSKISDSPPGLPEKFSGDAAVSIGDYTMLSHIQYAPEYLEVTFQSPEALSKMKMTYTGDVCSIAYDNLSLNLDVSDLPQAAFGRVIVQTMRQCISGADMTVNRTESGWIYTGSSAIGDFEALQDPSTGALTRISCPEIQATIEFSNIQTQP
ncbi:MAG: hypothetical protein ACLU8W_07650 [Clostridia bacterium]